MKKEILIVDDNRAILKQLGALLSEAYEFSLATSGEEALSFCELETPDLVLLDVEMPGMDGFETIVRLKSIPSMRGVPVIFLTGFNDADTEIKALELGAMDFITKPAEKDILLYRIKIHLDLCEYKNNLESRKSALENNIVISFAEIIECKDNNSGDHVLRTSKYVETIGGELLRKGLFPGELSPENLELMIRGAPFHDIGKIGITDAILRKDTTLTSAEYNQIKNHTVIGARVLEQFHLREPEQLYLKYASIMAGGHHERFDGNGYPYGLKGAEIPFCCRLLAVANVYDACLTERIYRPALSQDEAYRIIWQGSGTEFDPTIVDAFTSAGKEIAAIRTVFHN
ncbi:MAG: response regulator [Deltaproteobacteria bacterium]|jgi:putative two-component system response regulator|nr:response regulator [Deltaproteobacteria bacterium]